MDNFFILMGCIFVIYVILLYCFFKITSAHEVIIKYMKYITVVTVFLFTIQFTLQNYLEEEEFKYEKEISFAKIHKEKIKLERWIDYNHQKLNKINKLRKRKSFIFIYWNVGISIGLLFMLFSEIIEGRGKKKVKMITTDNKKLLAYKKKKNLI